MTTTWSNQGAAAPMRVVKRVVDFPTGCFQCDLIVRRATE
jgi:hypothetical protein